MASVRAALTIAADRFVDPKFQALRSPAADLDALAAVLGDSTIGGFDVKAVINEPGAIVGQELERFFSNRKPDDLLLVYFSCHGVKDAAGRLYFATTDTEFELLRSTGISASFVSEQMEYSRSKRIILLLDCCYSGAFLKGFRARGDATVAVEQLEGRGRAVITASRSTEYAFEADELTAEDAKPSVFTHAIVEGLSSGRADVNRDGLVTIDELYDFVYDEVRGKVAGQTPGRWADVEGDLVVARNPKPPPRSTALPAELVRAIDSDLALQRLGAVAELARWYRSESLDAQAAAEGMLERLTRDYDERVRSAATAALESVGHHRSAQGIGSIPATLPAAVASAASADAVGPTGVVDGVARVAAGTAVLGGLLIVVAGQLQYLICECDNRRLALHGWYNYASAVMLVLVTAAATSIMRRTARAELGLSVLTALVPVAFVEVVLGIVENFDRTGGNLHSGTGLGWKLAMVGFGSIVWAGGVAGARLFRAYSVSGLGAEREDQPGQARRSLLPVAGMVVGFLLTLGFGWDTTFHYPPSFVVAVGLKLLLLSVFVYGCWPHRSDRRVRMALLTSVAAVGIAVLVDSQTLAPAGYTDPWYELPAGLVALGNAAVPLVATLVVSDRRSAVALMAWLVASQTMLRSDAYSLGDTTAHAVHAVGLAAAAALAFVLWRMNGEPSGESAGVPSVSPVR